MRSDPEDYGKFRVLQLPTNTQTQGPQQAQNSMTSDPEWRRNGRCSSSPTGLMYGNLLTLPIADGGILYVEPLYTQRNCGQLDVPAVGARPGQYQPTPTGIRVGYAPTLAEALDQVFGSGTGNVATAPSGEQGPSQPEQNGQTAPTTPTPAPPQGGQAPNKEAAVAELDAALKNLQTAQQGGDFKAYGDALDRLQKAVQDYQTAGR